MTMTYIVLGFVAVVVIVVVGKRLDNEEEK